LGWAGAVGGSGVVDGAMGVAFCAAAFEVVGLEKFAAVGDIGAGATVGCGARGAWCISSAIMVYYYVSQKDKAKGCARNYAMCKRANVL
jgi:hypothetical protein